ncbi:YifB family Mg chelatase-like AAA ATPase [Natronincola ferrireducens]|uniref:Magnesium chelatase family protein n=1 Tax=Natronincola ferrireducens TaxID=393762 RepID=A0A1G9C047_9FIRM|nr:YifB family Mg chelatase-like AAA ATPase [Natronincola ferrireducens]SDK44804.1 magnesium chelatase family protein [Natronincola ferrireducens]
MLAKVKTSCYYGLLATEIEVEVDITNGLPVVNIVGLPDVALKESKERVRSAINNSGLEFPLKRITINLSPADTKKEGTHFDLPIALGILAASGQIQLAKLAQVVVLGELSLDGEVNRVNGVLPMLLEMYTQGFRKVILPLANIEEAKAVRDLECIGIQSLKELISFINNEVEIETHTGSVLATWGNAEFQEDFKDLRGQENLKRGLEIAAAGSHNLLMIGPPGSGKTMAARRLPSIMPKLTFEEAMEITKIYSVAGLLDANKGLITQRPFRSPHHTASMVALTGGGRIPKPGEVSLSHYGVLFLDELLEFNKNVLEVLRQPIEDGHITISRVNASFTFPAKFMLIGSMNPCPCGYYGSENRGHTCNCTIQQVNRYVSKVSGPLLDRMDIVIETAAVSYGDLTSNIKAEGSKEIRKRVEKARQKQLDRYEGTQFMVNSQLTPSALKKYCHLDSNSHNLLSNAFSKLNLSARAYNRIIKISRTIADLDESDSIKSHHVAEALQYRRVNNLMGR